jgi:hypothetical protein
MLMHPVNELTFQVTIESTSPLLVKEARYNAELKKNWARSEEHKKLMPDAIPISRAAEQQVRDAVTDKTDPRGAVSKLDFFLPGSSIRGVCRAHLERTLRSLDRPESPRVCDPFEDDAATYAASCSAVLTKRRKEDKEFRPYASSCPVCRLFGSTLQSSRITFSDGTWINRDGKLLVQREHVRIDRRTGAVGGPPLKFLGLLGARFQFEMKLRNFELSHVMLAGSC